MPAYGTPPRALFGGEKAYLFGSINNTTPPPAGVSDNTETAELLSAITKSVCVSVAPVQAGISYTQRTIVWSTIFPSLPVAVDIVLEHALRDIDAEYSMLDETTNAAGELRQTPPTACEYFRARLVSFSGGSSPSVVLKMKGV